VRAYVSLRTRADFAYVHRRGRRRSGTYLTCVVAAGRDRSRVGITVSTAVGNAVERNRIRRRVKAILDRYGLDRPPFRDVVFVARPGTASLGFDELVQEVERTFGKPS
jgi:ribonuclease P protein component